MQALLAPLALLIERLVGYPNNLVARIGHPVMWIGRLISLLDLRLNRDANRRGKGILALIILLAVTGAIAIAIAWLCRLIP
jgi:adenosylcobinamide-phosphate synthase